METMATKPRQQATTTERYHLVDALRGLCISGVVLYHLLYDIYHVYGRNPEWDQQLYCRIWQEGTCLFLSLWRALFGGWGASPACAVGWSSIYWAW